jgi:hypothetical protein
VRDKVADASHMMHCGSPTVCVSRCGWALECSGPRRIGPELVSQPRVCTKEQSASPCGGKSEVNSHVSTESQKWLLSRPLLLLLLLLSGIHDWGS